MIPRAIEFTKSFRRFIDDEFPRIGKYVENYDNSKVNTNQNKDIYKDENYVNLEKDVEVLWEDVSSNKKALKTVEESLISMIEIRRSRKN